MKLVNTKEKEVTALDGKATALFEDMLDGYLQRTASKRFTERHAQDVVRRCREFARFSDLPPWFWTEDHFDKWNHHLCYRRQIKPSTQRKYQQAIRAFLEYLQSSPKFIERVRRDYGAQLRQIVTRDNVVIHVDEDDSEGGRRPFTPAELQAFLGEIEKEIALHRSHKGGSRRKFQAACRDRAIFLTVYVLGLRADEVLRLNLESFFPSPRHPEFGDFGAAAVLGKAKKGGGKRHRTVPIDHPQLPVILAWYVKDIRKLFLDKADANERALFLSEKGKRLSYSSLWDRFDFYRGMSSVSLSHLVIHSLRHTTATETLVQTDAETTRRKLGHSNLGTTTGYTHVPDKFVAHQTEELLKRRSERLKETKT